MLDIKNRETLEIYVLGDDFKFYQNLKYLPLTSYPSLIPQHYNLTLFISS